MQARPASLMRQLVGYSLAPSPEVWSLEGLRGDFGSIPRTPWPWSLFLADMQEGPSSLTVPCIL